MPGTITKLKPNTECSCGQIMRMNKNNPDILNCEHCDNICDIRDCRACRKFELGSAHKKLTTWNPLALYADRPSLA